MNTRDPPASLTHLLPSVPQCPLCQSLRVESDELRGERVCADCGCVVEGNLLTSDRGPVRADEPGTREGRGYGSPTSSLLPDHGLPTEIASPRRDYQGRALSRESVVKFYHLRRLNQRTRGSRTRQRNLTVAFAEIQRLATALGLSREVRESATLIYRRALDHRSTRGKKIVALTAAAVYAACRQCHVPRTMKEVIAVSKASKIEVGRAFTLLSRELRLALRPLEPRDYLVRFAQDLNLSRPVRQKVLELLERVEKHYSSSGVLPHGVLATIIYIACTTSGEPRSQDRVAAVANVTPVTIRNHYKEFLELLGLPRPAISIAVTNGMRGIATGEAASASDAAEGS